VGVLHCSAMLYSRCIVENTLFEDDNDENTFRVFNSTQVFLYLKKELLLTCCGAQAHTLVIILLRNCVFF
jgi:hypothetical protein